MSEPNYLTEDQVEQQEHLSTEKLALLKPKYGRLGDTGVADTVAGRPPENLIDLMHWVKNIFGEDIEPSEKKRADLHPWVHNKIVIDGSFLQFAKDEGVKVECLYRDAIASWRSDKKYEHFMAQGVFKITYKKLSFIHAALFHKGNQNEDEVSFFVVVGDHKYEEYIAFRNKFDDWLQKRDRENLEIHVVGGEGQPYERNMPWDDVFLPDVLKDDIKNTVEGFLASKELYEKKKIPWKRGILFYGEPGNGKTTTIRTIISNYDFKPVTVQSSNQTNDEMITEAFEYALEQSPALLYIEDLDSLLGTSVSVSHFLNLLDGVSSRNGILVIATANNLDKLNEAVTDRPSRFDRKILIPLPDKDMTKRYLKHWFGKGLKAAEITKIAEDTVGMNFSYAYLKELYLTAAYHAIADNRETPTYKDVKLGLDQLLRDKERALSGHETDVHEEIGIL